MSVLFAVLSLLGLCFGCKRFFKVSIESCPLRVASFVIMVLYGFAYCAYLRLGVMIIIVIGCLAFLYACRMFVLEKNIAITQYLTPGFTAWLLFTIIAACFTAAEPLTVWDEFMHWAPMARLMSERGDLAYGDMQLVHPSYPPGARLFYMLFFVKSGFSEAKAYVAQIFLLCSPIALLLEGYAWQQWRRVFLLAISVFSLIFFLLNSWLAVTSLCLDVLVAFYIGAILVCYWHSDKQPISMAGLIPMTCALVLFKPQLFSFVLLIVWMLAFDQWIRQTKGLLVLMAMTLATWFTTQSWALYMQHLNIPLEWHTKGVYSMLEFFNAIFYPTNLEVLRRIKIIIFFELPMLTLLGYITFLLPFMMQKGIARRAWWWMNLWWLIGLFFYLFALSGLFLTVYPVYYANSFSRYSSIYVIAWGFFVARGVSTECMKITIPWSLFIKNIIFLSLCVIASISVFFYMRNQEQETMLGHTPQQLYAAALTIATPVQEKTPKNARIFIVWQNSTGLGRTMLTYLLFPRGYNAIPTAFGVMTHKKQRGWKSDFTKEQFLEALTGFDYILLAHTDAEFWRLYGSLFKPKTPIARYTVCEGETFDSLLKPGCRLQTFYAYLFKIQAPPMKSVQ